MWLTASLLHILKAVKSLETSNPFRIPPPSSKEVQRSLHNDQPEILHKATSLEIFSSSL